MILNFKMLVNCPNTKNAGEAICCVWTSAHTPEVLQIPNTPAGDAIRCVSFAFMRIFKHSRVGGLVAGSVCLNSLELVFQLCCCEELKVSTHYHSSVLDQLLRRRPPLGWHPNYSMSVHSVDLVLSTLKDVLIRVIFAEGEEDMISVLFCFFKQNPRWLAGDKQRQVTSGGGCTETTANRKSSSFL